jgi:methyl-accepting chemotaxis protein
VRTPAQTSEKSARDIPVAIAQITAEARQIDEGIIASAHSAADEVERAKSVTEQLEAVRVEIAAVMDGGRAIAKSSAERARDPPDSAGLPFRSC